jgi:hypothetical protein
MAAYFTTFADLMDVLSQMPAQSLVQNLAVVIPGCVRSTQIRNPAI